VPGRGDENETPSRSGIEPRSFFSKPVPAHTGLYNDFVYWSGVESATFIQGCRYPHLIFVTCSSAVTFTATDRTLQIKVSKSWTMRLSGHVAHIIF
jgi:hypothetical protein